jgi:hypothetical protein
MKTGGGLNRAHGHSERGGFTSLKAISSYAKPTCTGNRTAPCGLRGLQRERIDPNSIAGSGRVTRYLIAALSASFIGGTMCVLPGYAIQEGALS